MRYDQIFLTAVFQGLGWVGPALIFFALKHVLGI